MTLESNGHMTVAEVAAGLAALPPELQDYEVWVAADPSDYIGPTLVTWIDHEGRRVHL